MCGPVTLGYFFPLSRVIFYYRFASKFLPSLPSFI